MKRLILTLLGCLGAAIPLAAQYGGACCAPCPTPCCGRFEVGGELLWWRPSTCDLVFAISDPRTFEEIVGNPVDLSNLDNAFPVGQKRAIRPDHKLGFRAWAAFIANNCVDITGEYTRFHHHYNAFATPENDGGLWPTFLHPNHVPTILYDPADPPINGEVEATATAHAVFDYDAAEIQLGSRATFGCNCALWVRGFAAVHYYNLCHKFETLYEGTEDPGQADESTSYLIESRRSAKVWGVGPRLGMQAAYDVACGLGVGGKLGVGILGGGGCTKRFEQVQTFQNQNSPVQLLNEVLDLKESERLHVVPRIDARLGVNYTVCLCSCLVISAEVGYEFISYLNPIRSEIFTGQRATSREFCNALNFDGIYVSVMGQF